MATRRPGRRSGRFPAKRLTPELDRARAIASELARPNDRARAIELTRDLARALTRANARAIASDLAKARDRARAVALSEIDASGADLSRGDFSDLSLLEGVIWTRETVWPPGIAEQVERRSEKIAPDVYRVRGGTERDRSNLVTS